MMLSADDRRMVCVTWQDATSYSGWNSPETLASFTKDRGVLTCYSIGYLLHKGTDTVVIAQSYSADNGKIGDALQIPSSIVTKITPIGPKNRRAKGGRSARTTPHPQPPKSPPVRAESRHESLISED